MGLPEWVTVGFWALHSRQFYVGDALPMRHAFLPLCCDCQGRNVVIRLLNALQGDVPDRKPVL